MKLVISGHSYCTVKLVIERTPHCTVKGCHRRTPHCTVKGVMYRQAQYNKTCNRRTPHCTVKFVISGHPTVQWNLSKADTLLYMPMVDKASKCEGLKSTWVYWGPRTKFCSDSKFKCNCMTNFAVLFHGNSDDSKTTRIVNHQGNHYVVFLLDSICFFFTESGSLHLKTIYTHVHI